MGVKFTPDGTRTHSLVPDWEDATAATAPYYSSKLSLQKAIEEIKKWTLKLDASVMDIVSGSYVVDPDPRERYGYIIHFSYKGLPGQIRVVGLPIRDKIGLTRRAMLFETKLERVRVQALLNVRDWLKSAFTASIFNPDASPLIPYLTTGDGRSVAEMVKDGTMLMLSASKEI